MSESFLRLLQYLQACPEVFFRPQNCSPENWYPVCLALINALWERLEPKHACPLPLLSTEAAVCEWIGPLSWLLSAPEPLLKTLSGTRCLEILQSLSHQMASLFAPRALCFEPERAEECLRYLWAHLGETIPGETQTQSATRLKDISTQQKQHLLAQRAQLERRQTAIQQAQARLKWIEHSD